MSFHTPVEAMLGNPDRCTKISDEISMHWYPKGSKPGDKCWCGDKTMQAQEGQR